MRFTTLEVGVSGLRAEIALNRPEKLNALSGEMLLELADAARFLDQQEAVKVVVVGGRGRAFSSGADVSVFAAEDPGPSARRASADVGRLMIGRSDDRHDRPIRSSQAVGRPAAA
jgi:enoyl-CoA hydratase/carnithine racemase